MNTIRRKTIAVGMLLLLVLAPIINSAARAGGLASDPNEPYSLPVAKAGVGYEYQLQSDGGLAPLTWRLVEGELPPGLKLDPTGKLQGLPSGPQREAYRFVIEVSDSSETPQRYSQVFAIQVQAAPLRIVTGENRLRMVLPAANQESETPPPSPASAARNVILIPSLPSPDASAPDRATVYSTRLHPGGESRAPGRSRKAKDFDGERASSAKQIDTSDADPTVPEKKPSRVDPAQFLRIYELPRMNGTFRGNEDEDYGRLIYDPQKPHLSSLKLSVDESSTVKIVPVPKYIDLDMTLNSLYMSAHLASGEKDQSLQVINYSEIGKDPSALDSQIGASFESVRNVMSKLLLLELRTSQVLLDTYAPDRPTCPPTELTREIFREKEMKPGIKALNKTFGDKLLLFQAEIKSFGDYFTDPKNREVVTIVANDVFHIDRDSLIEIARQYRDDTALLDSKDDAGAAKEAAEGRLRERTKLIYEDFRGARIAVRAIAAHPDAYKPRMSKDKGVTGLQARLIALVNSPASESDGCIKERAQEQLAREIYAEDVAKEELNKLKNKFLPGYVSLDKAKAQDGDTLYLSVTAQNSEGVGVGGTAPFEISVKKYGVKVHLASSFMFIKRRNVTAADAQPLPPPGGPAPTGASTVQTISKVNFAPSPGVSYGLTFFKRGQGEGSKFLRMLAPTVGINVSFMNFTDPGFDLSKNQFTNTTGTNVQVGAGPVFSLFNNKLDLTYGWNLNVDRKRAYFGIGFGFVEIAKEVSKIVKTGTASGSTP